jgi:hypothetical protein
MAQDNDFYERIANFLEHYMKHQEFCGLAFQKTIVLEVYSSDLKKLAVRWVEARIESAEKYDHQDTGENKSKAPLDQSHGSTFVEYRELAELTCLTGGLKGLAESFAGMRAWLEDVEGVSRDAFRLPSDNVALNHFLLDWLVTLNVEEQALHDFLFASKLLAKAAGLIETMNSSQRKMRAELAESRFVRRLLLVASEIVSEGASVARASAERVLANERRWRDLIEKAMQLRLQGREARQASE